MHPLMIAAALALTAAAPAPADPAGTNKPVAAKAGCRTPANKPARCMAKPAKGVSRARVSTPMISRCRDVVSHQITRCGGSNAEPVPAN